MRILAALLAVLALAACDSGAPRDGADNGPRVDDQSAAVIASTGGAFDYRYAYRLPAPRVKAVLESHAAGCDRLGPARCRILAMRYKVDDANNISAMLTVRIDPAVARAFGEAATRTVTGVDGVLTETQIAGADATAAARGNALVERLREQLANSRALARNEGEGSASAQRATRIDNALKTIAEVESSQGESQATAPVLITYRSGAPLAGFGAPPDATFRTAGNQLVSSLAAMAQVLANIGPWVLLLLVIVLVLRRIIHGSESAPAYDDTRPMAMPASASAYHEPEPENRNIIQRWFNRDDEGERT